MKDTDYTFAVARTRSREAGLLTGNDFLSLITADYEEATRRLNENGYRIEGFAYGEALKNREREAVDFITEVLPDTSQFDSIFIYNDFYNLKVLLKALITGGNADDLLLSPTVYPAEEVKNSVYNRKNEALPLALAHADRSGYRILTQTGFAQLADAVIDRAAMEQSAISAKKADNAVMTRLSDIKIAVTDMKILYRCIKAQKAESFMKRSVAENGIFDAADAVKAAIKGEAALTEFFSHTELGDLSVAFMQNPTAFEKQCDDKIIKILKETKSDTFGIAPLVGYYFGVLTEVKNLRILLAGKLSGQTQEALTERMREAYV